MGGLEMHNGLFLWVLLGIPLLATLLVASFIFRHRTLKALGDINLVRRLIPEYSVARPIVKGAIWLLAFTFLVLAAVDFKRGTKMVEAERSGLEVIFALDVSNSMLAEDLWPNRLERAKLAISQQLKDFKGNKVGLVVFAGDAYVQMPLTSDYARAKLFLKSINTGTVPVQGTSIGSAIKIGTGAFSKDSQAGRALILMTDGENHEDDAVAMAKTARDSGVSVFTIGFGDPNGQPIPEYGPNGKKEFKKDREGNRVITKLNEKMLREISDAGGGRYVRATSSDVGLGLVFQEIDKQEKQILETREFSDYAHYYQIFLGIGLLLIAVEFFIMPRRNRHLMRLNLFGKQEDE